VFSTIYILVTEDSRAATLA